DNEFSRAVLARLDDTFRWEQLEEEVIRALRSDRFQEESRRPTADGMLALARANYEVCFDETSDLSQRLIFPTTPAEEHGIEDARFVRFIEDDGRVTYYATYTAFDGQVVFPQLLETRDFLRFKISTLNGPAVQNKGMALFPRRIHGCYAMLSRQDGENLYLMYSDMLHFWYEKRLLLRPTYPWEFVQVGNCGSPIETEAGWLVLTHGVGPMRRYAIGAVLLDRDNPEKVIGRLREPLLTPTEDERDGYVPNVLYTCGALVHAGRLIIPYAMSDQCTSFATVELKELLEALT
ncbi:MAG: glycosidase, partial [Verrucomicrobia bacterium]